MRPQRSPGSQQDTSTSKGVCHVIRPTMKEIGLKKLSGKNVLLIEGFRLGLIKKMLFVKEIKRLLEFTCQPIDECVIRIEIA